MRLDPNVVLLEFLALSDDGGLEVGFAGGGHNLYLEKRVNFFNSDSVEEKVAAPVNAPESQLRMQFFNRDRWACFDITSSKSKKICLSGLHSLAFRGAAS